MSVQTKLARWRMLANFALCRLGDYAELLSIEAADARARLLREFIALAALTVSGLFTLSFFCLALIASAWSKPYFLYVVWGIAVAWLVLSLVALCAFRALSPAPAFRLVKDEMRADLETLREALK
ncbi:phage holin family protein [Paraburkholderia guartelaensis]|uniref:Phage holin family protein n=1 Tax=Paraburkholderia guartelaensis TaxID=2546446 RepID=A0A4V2ZV24_9BURK|nr:phage holin family protein [Paraburkholderia guartelaensis]TDG03418.1 phage holin family protein [Paraburkholderia guartelaensis]